MNKTFHFQAQITLLADVAHPKIHGIRSGYQPHHQFPGLDFLVSRIHHYQDNVRHYPGEILIAQIKILHWPGVQDAVQIGTDFEMYEVSRLIAKGSVTALRSNT